MASVDLIFEYPPASNGDLVFGGTPVPEGAYEVTVNATLPSLVIAVVIGDPREVEVDALLPGLSIAVEVSYDIAVQRPTVGQSTSHWQKADQAVTGSQSLTQDVQPLPFGRQSKWRRAVGAIAGVEARKPRTLASNRVSASAHHDNAVQVRSQTTASHQVMLGTCRPALTTLFQDGGDVRASLASVYQDRHRVRRPSLRSAMQTAQSLRNIVGHSFGAAVSVRKATLAKHQDGMRPPAGIQTQVIPPLPQLCYTPSPHVLFSGLPGGSNLLFICNNHVSPGGETIIVPIRRVYIVINEVWLRRVVGNIQIQTIELAMSLDEKSWTWGFSATLPLRARDAVERDSSGEPVEVEASINGALYRFMIESVSQERTFTQTVMRITGRGLSAALDDPYAPTLSFGNTQARTAQQLMDDVLTVNGVPLGWAVDWQLDDWLVPAGAYVHQGTYMSAINSVATAAGAYIQPHDTAQTLRVLARYPVAPWEWSGVTPDYELPADVVAREGIEWLDKPGYNRVFVSGVGQGILADVRRTGSAGDQLAPMVTDPLITDAAAGRQRGLSVLAAGGRKAMVSLRVPVLEGVGVIKPGKFVRYVDGASTRLGLVRGVSLSSRFPVLSQTIGVETHV